MLKKPFCMITFVIFLFGISGGELLILLLVVLLLFGPKKIPEIARMIGRGMNEVKKVQREINTEIHRYSSDIERETKSMESDVREMTRETDAETPVKQNKKGPEELSAPEKQHEDTGSDEDLPYPYSDNKGKE